jgi:hypothetical protein
MTFFLKIAIFNVIILSRYINNVMSITKQITVYEAVENAGVVDKDSSSRYESIERVRIKTLYNANSLIKSEIASILIKNIIYGVIPIVNNVAKYKLHLQFHIPIMTITYDKKIKIYAPGDIIPVVGIYFDADKVSAQFIPICSNLDYIPRDDRLLLGDSGIRTMDYTWNTITVPRIMANLNTPSIPSTYKNFVSIFNDDNDAIKNITDIMTIMRSIKKYVYVTRFTQRLITIGDSASFVINDPGPGLSNSYKEINVLHSDQNEEHLSKINIKHIEREQLACLNADNARTAWKDNISRSEFGPKFNDLISNQKEIVNNKYKYEHDTMLGTRANKCKHINLKRKVMRSKGAVFDKEAWEELKGYAPLDEQPEKRGDSVVIPEYNDGISCKVCRLWCLCPHHYHIFDFIDSMFEGDTDKMMDSLIINFSINKSNNDDSYFCKICGELLKQNLVEGEIWAMKIQSGDSHINDDTYENMYNIVSNVISMNIDFGSVLINKKSLINGVTENIDKFIRKYELKLAMIKTIAESVKFSSLRIMINIYAIISAIRLSVIYGGNITLKGANVKGMKENELLHKLFNHAYKFITTQNKLAIANNPAFTPDRIKKIFTHAYKQISGLTIEIEEIKKIGINNPILNNPVYDFIYYGWVLSDLSRGKKRPTPFRDLKRIIGIDNIEEFDKMKMIFDRAVMPPSWKGIPEYYWDSWSTVAARLISGTFIRDKKNIKKIDEEQNALRVRESDIQKDLHLYHNIMSSMPDKWSPYRHTIEPAKQALSNIFCNDGRAHKWNIYVYKSGDKTIEVKIGEFGSSSMDDYNFISQKCSICGNIFGSAPAEDIEINVKHLDKMNSFYIYFQYKCPVSFRHEYKDGKCVNCGITWDMMDNKDGQYYEKYESTYDSRYSKTNADKYGISSIEIPLMMTADPNNSFVVKKYKKWEFTMVNITTVSKLMNVAYNVLINIGLMERFYFSDIESGKINPSSKASAGDLNIQINAIVRHIIHLDLTYNRFTACSDKIHPDLIDLCRAQNTDVRGLEMLSMVDFYKEYEYRTEHESLLLNVNWALDFLCTMVIGFNNKDRDLKYSFINIFMKDLVQTEVNMSKPVLFKRDVVSARAVLDNFDMGLKTLTVSDAMAKEVMGTDDGGDDTDDPFSLSGLDIENYAESMGQD